MKRSPSVPRALRVSMRRRRLALVAILGSLGALVAAGSGIAAPPANDELANATPITSLPFSDETDTTEATWPSSGEGGCAVSGHTIWYSLTLTHDATIRARIVGTGFLPSLTLWHSGTPPAATPVCADVGGQLTYRVRADATYYFQVATRFFWEPGGPITLSVEEIPPPANDAFADATKVTSLPFSETGDMTAATIEPGEPQASPYYPPPASVWYQFTPEVSGRVTAGGSAVMIAAYTGSEVEDLHLIDARELGYGIPLTIEVTAGTPVAFQVVPAFGGGGGLYGPYSFTLFETPAPEASFGFGPGDPSRFDTISFYNSSYDPVSLGITGYSWDFGDGASSTDPYPTHRYARDGSYDVTLTVTTTDGRIGSRTSTVAVRTHDVAILWITAPNKARVGRTYTIMVGVGNTSYPETVSVLLSRSTPNWFEQIAALEKPVPVMGPKKATVFSFTYTFTAADVEAGKVSFQAQAFPLTRDALSSDNTAISQATQVTR